MIPSPAPHTRPPQLHIYRQTWGILLFVALIAACLWIAAPFLALSGWAIIMAVSVWPGYVHLSRWLGGRRRLTALLFAVIGFVILVLPIVLGGVSAARQAPAMVQAVADVARHGLPGPPDAVAHWPLIGPWLHDTWAQASTNGSAVLAQYRGTIMDTARWLLFRAGSFGLAMLQFALAIVIAAFLLVRADGAIALLQAFAGKIGGATGQDLLPVTAHTIRAVAFGVVGTSLVEGVLAATGYAIAGVSVAGVLGGATFLLCILQAGPGFVFIPAVAWMWWQDAPGWAIFVLAWHLTLVIPVEMFGRPYFISRGTGLPMLLIFVGVLGGVLAFGFIGIFLGATVLAVAYRLLLRWLAPTQHAG